MDPTYVRTLRDGPITTLVLDRPEKRNALSLEVMRELTAAVAAAGESDAVGVILAANGPVFSAGHNFADMRGASLAEARALFATCTAMLDTIQAIPQPVCAKVHALATAAGCQLVATCDLAVASEDAAFAIPGGKGGLFCHTPLVAVARNVGRKRALGDGDDRRPDRRPHRRRLGTRQPRGARRPARRGDVRAHLPCDARSAESKALGKHGFYAQIDLDQQKAYAYAMELMASAAVTSEAQEGIAAFLEKRPAKFASGR